MDELSESRNESLTFSQRLEGRFEGVVRETDAHQLSESVGQSDGWYLIDPSADSPQISVTGEKAQSHLNTLVAEILSAEQGVWSTMVYAQTLKDPWLIKVFHPRRAGCGCGEGGGILPWWVLSRIPPEPIPAWHSAICSIDANSGKKWWQKLF